MKKTTIIGKKQILMVAMVLALGAAVWLNVRYATDGTDYSATSSVADEDLGNAKYVANASVVTEDDYFTTAKKEREQQREEELKTIKKTLNDQKSTESQKKLAAETTTKITNRMEQESAIESLVTAKGFKKVIAVLSDDSCSVVVQSENELQKSASAQIVDIVSSVTKIKLENIKIVTVK